MKIFPLTDSILLPLAPTIVGTIAAYLQSITQQIDIKPHSQSCANEIGKLQLDLSEQWQFQRSIRQIPTSQYQYVSTIAHQLAAKSALTPLEICQQLHHSHSALTDLHSRPEALQDRSISLELSAWYNQASYIYVQFTPRSIEIWLNYIHDLPLDRLDLNLPSQSAGLDRLAVPTAAPITLESIDLAIYAHARCCALLKLAATEKLVTVTANWQIITPNWSTAASSGANQPPAELDCIFDHVVEQRLIQTLMAVTAAIHGPNRPLIIGQSTSSPCQPPNWPRLTIDLAQSWIEFHRHCQIFGDLRRDNPRLAVARCQLTAISRRYLQVLLEYYLDAVVLFEL